MNARTAAAKPLGAEASRGFRDLRLDRYGTLIAFALLLAYFALTLGSSFAGADNVKLVLVQQSPAVIVALGLTVALSAGQFDLSIGSVVGLGSVLSAGLVAESHLSVVPALLIVLGVGALVGLINAVLVLMLQLQSLIVTLGTSSVCLGVTLWYTEGTTIASGFPASMESIGNGVTLGLERTTIYMLIVAVIVYVLLERTTIGRNLYATGSNSVAARLAGVKTARYVLLGLVTSGTLAALAGFIITARTASGNPAVGAPYLLPAFAAAYLGAWTLSSGRFHVVGTVLGGILVALSSNGLVLSGLPFYINPIFTGVVLVAAVGFGSVLRRVHQRR